MNERKRRIAENEAIFRSVNEQIQGVGVTAATAEDEIGIVCECGTTSCTDRITVPRSDYERVRADSKLFILRPGHDDPESETVVEKLPGYWIVVKKPGLAANIVEALDER